MGPAPKWCSFLDNLTEELEANPMSNGKFYTFLFILNQHFFVYFLLNKLTFLNYFIFTLQCLLSLRRLQIRNQTGTRDTGPGQPDWYECAARLHARLLHGHTTIQEG